MSTVEEIKEQILALSLEEQADFRDWLLDLLSDPGDERPVHDAP